MALATVQVNGQPVQTVVLPSSPAMRTVEWKVSDAVAVNRSPFTGVTQTYVWPGADEWSGTMTLPLLTQDQADAWIAALMECRGMLLPFLLGDPLKVSPAGNLQGSVPLVDGSGAVSNVAGTTQLAVRGLAASAFGLLLPGDYVQVGYRMHRNLGRVASDANGKAVLSLWPSLRELPADGLALTLANPQGLFRRADNAQVWSATVGRLTSLSFGVVEWR